jgi:hypothetical protein
MRIRMDLSVHGEADLDLSVNKLSVISNKTDVTTSAGSFSPHINSVYSGKACSRLRRIRSGSMS